MASKHMSPNSREAIYAYDPILGSVFEVQGTSANGAINVNATVSLSGSPIPITGATTALVVGIVDGSGNQITSFGGGTQYADGAARGTATGTIAMVDDGTLIQSAKGDTDGTQQVNNTKVSGTAVSVSNGTTDAGTQRVTLSSDSTGQVKLAAGANTIGALTANQSVNESQINGITPLMGNGVTGTGSQRVTIASDNTAFAVNATLSAETTKVIGTVNQGTAAALASGWPMLNGEASDTAGTFTNATQTTSVTATSLDGYGNVLISINGTYGTATAIFEGSDDGGTTWYGISEADRTDSNIIESGYTSLTNTSRAWQISNPGWDSVRVRSTAVASGTVNVRISPSAAPTSAGASVSIGVALPAGANSIGTVDTELPAAAVLADGAANPTTPTVGAFGSTFNGSTWDRISGGNRFGDGSSATGAVLGAPLVYNGTSFDRMRSAGGGTGTQAVGGLTASGASLVVAPVTTGALAKTTLPTAVSDAQVVNTMSDKYGRSVILNNTIRDLTGSQTTTITSSTAETTIITQAASVFNDLISIFISNTSATATRVDIRDTTGGSVIFQLFIPAGDMRGISLTTPWPQTTVNTNWTAQSSASVADLRVSTLFAKNR